MFGAPNLLIKKSKGVKFATAVMRFGRTKLLTAALGLPVTVCNVGGAVPRV